MSKKSFVGGINSLISEAPQKRGKGRPRTQEKDSAVVPTSELGTRDGETRTTFIMSKELLQKLKAVAYWERKTIREIVTEAIDADLARREKKGGPIEPRPHAIRKRELEELQSRINIKNPGRQAELPKY